MLYLKLSLSSHGCSFGWNVHDVPLAMPHTRCCLYEPLEGRFIFAPFRCDWFATQGMPTAVWDRLCIAQGAVGFMNRSDMHLSIIWIWTFPLQWPRDRLRNSWLCMWAHRLSSWKRKKMYRRCSYDKSVSKCKNILNECIVRLVQQHTQERKENAHILWYLE